MTARPVALAALQRQLAAGEVTPLEVLESCLEQLDAAQAAGAFVAVDEGAARRAASRRRTGQPRPLHGIPVAVKDLIDVEGLPTALGRSRGRVAIADAEIVARLRAAGAIIVGKTRTDELGLGALTPGSCDPRDQARSVGGSSGGSAIAVAVGVAPLAVATDTAGSARIPAAACGVTGLCPPAGWVGSPGIATLSPSCDRIGLIAARPADVAAAWQALGNAAPSTWTGRACVFDADALDTVDPQWADAAAAAARALDADSITLSGPAPVAFGPPRGILITAEAAQLHSPADTESAAARAQLEAGGAVDAATLQAARADLRTLGEALRRAIGGGVLVTPTLAAPPPRWDELGDVTAQRRATGRLTRLCGPVNTSGLVAMSVPYHVDATGHPVGVQLIAARVGTVFAAARLLLGDDRG